MANLTYAQLEATWIAAGGSRNMAPLMAAIAMAESGGNPRALNPNDNGGRQTSWGLWQISLGNHNAPSPNWANPIENAKLALGKLHSQGLGAWGTFTSGAFRKFLRGNVPPGAAPKGGGAAGSGGGGGGGTGGTTPAELTAFTTGSSGGVLADAGALLHGTAVLLDRAFGLFAPGQGWRIVFGIVAAGSGLGSYRAFRTGGEDGNGNLPLAILLAGTGAVALFMMARPWPQTSAGPIKPGAYVVDVLEGQPPPAGPAAFSPAEVRLTEAGLGTLLALWAAGKAGQGLAGIAAGAAAGGGILGKLWTWIKGLGSEAEGAAGDVPVVPEVIV